MKAWMMCSDCGYQQSIDADVALSASGKCPTCGSFNNVLEVGTKAPSWFIEPGAPAQLGKGE